MSKLTKSNIRYTLGKYIFKNYSDYYYNSLFTYLKVFFNDVKIILKIFKFFNLYSTLCMYLHCTLLPQTFFYGNLCIIISIIVFVYIIINYNII